MATKSSYDFDDNLVEGELLAPDGEWIGGYDHTPVADSSTILATSDVTITIRTNFAETGLWVPHLVAKNGKLSFETTLPDSITTQRLTLMASDKAGGSGVKHHDIEVTQDLYARSDLPATLTLGDTLEVQAAFRNNTSKSAKATLEFESDALIIVGKTKVKVEAKAGGTAVAKFTVRPKQAGMTTYMLSATGKGFKDVMERTIYVRPSGAPTRTEQTAVLEKGKPFKTTVELSGKQSYHTSFVHVSFPTAIPVLQGLEAMLDKPAGAIDFVASRALVAASVYRYLQKYSKDEKALVYVGKILQLSLAAVLMSQGDDGGWGWNCNLLVIDDTGNLKKEFSSTNAYMTAQAVESLLEMKEAGLPVPQDAVTRGLDSLASSVNSDGYWDMSAIAIWEGNSEQVKVGMSAEIFKVMAYAGVIYPDAANGSYQYAGTMSKLAPIYEGYLDAKTVEPFALANSALGVLYHAKRNGGPDKKVNAKLDAAAQRLLQMRDEAHWEPGWFNAWGGTIEATHAAMELMIKYDPQKYELELRRSMQYILSTQTSFGDWHNARGTASAIRALLLIPPTVPEKSSTVVIEVNGQKVKTVEINPDDPFLSAVALRMVEITAYLQDGKNQIEVSYDGNLEAPVSLLTEVWGDSKVAQVTTAAPNVSMVRTYSSDVIKSNMPTKVRLQGVIEGQRMPLIISEPIPSCASVEKASLEKLVQDGLIVDYIMMGDTVEFYLLPTKKIVDISYRLTGDRSGTCVQAGTEVTSVADFHAITYGKSTELEVQ
jgi:uncharacterized protein YfaS (alpha-2-macroglobulin family)